MNVLFVANLILFVVITIFWNMFLTSSVLGGNYAYRQISTVIVYNNSQRLATFNQILQHFLKLLWAENHFFHIRNMQAPTYLWLQSEVICWNYNSNSCLCLLMVQVEIICVSAIISTIKSSQIEVHWIKLIYELSQIQRNPILSEPSAFFSCKRCLWASILVAHTLMMASFVELGYLIRKIKLVQISLYLLSSNIFC